MVWFLVAIYLVVVCAAAYLVGRFGDYGMRDKVSVLAVVWPIMSVVFLPFVAMLLLAWLCDLGERHRK